MVTDDKKRGLNDEKLGMIFTYLEALPDDKIVSVSTFAREHGMHPSDGLKIINLIQSIQERPRIQVQNTNKATYIKLSKEPKADELVLLSLKQIDRKLDAIMGKK